MQIDIDFDVFKALTARRESEIHSFNEVIRELLGLPSKLDLEDTSKGRSLGGRFLPNGTKLRAKYKDIYYFGEISGEKFIYDGTNFTSASSAARAVTGTNINGLTFWDVQRPGEVEWIKLLSIPRDR